MYVNKKKPTKSSRFVRNAALLLSLITVVTSSPHAAFTPNRALIISPLAPSAHLRRSAPSTSFHKLYGKLKKPSQLHSLNLDNNDEMIQNSSGDEGIFDSIKSWVVATGSDVAYKKPPPIQIEDTSLLFYDIFLILNLTLSISFWVVHRLSFENILPAISEGSLLSILWVIAGLWNGAFLFSAVDGHYDTSKPEHEGKGGPTSAALLGLSTFVGTANLRILVALGTAVLEHRKVGVANGEELIPLEIAFGLMLMTGWRMLHSSYTRI